MGDLISRDYVLSEYDRQHKGPPGGARKIMEEAPAVDAMPVVHGRWIFVAWHKGLKVMECSICRKRAYGATAYCPTCAAKMDLEVSE